MTRTEHLLTIFAEECSEVAQRVSKALRFGTEEVQPGQPFSNADRIMSEVADLLAVYEMLIDEGVTTPIPDLYGLMNAKRMKVEKFLKFSAARGLVDGAPVDPSYPHPEAKETS